MNDPYLGSVPDRPSSRKLKPRSLHITAITLRTNRGIYCTVKLSTSNSPTAKMAMLHPSDSTFAQTDPLSPSLISSLFESSLGVSPANIESPTSSQGLYHKVYFVTLAESAHSRWSGKDVVLRVARLVSSPRLTELSLTWHRNL